MNDLYLIAIIAGEKVAIPAFKVDSVVMVREMIPVPSSENFVAGLFALRSRVLTLVDCQYFVTGKMCDQQKSCEAIVVDIGGYAYGLLVDSVQDVVHTKEGAKPMQRKLPEGWDEVGSAMLELDQESFLVVDPEMLVNPVSRAA